VGDDTAAVHDLDDEQVEAAALTEAVGEAEPPRPPSPHPFPGTDTMSHIVSVQTELRDPAAVAAACTRLGLPQPIHGTARIFESEATGLLVELPDWLYPVVIDVSTAQVRFDNYGGAWGDSQQLDLLLQAYAVEKARIEARQRGHSVAEQTLDDGSIKLTIQVGGPESPTPSSRPWWRKWW
jgi:hypothetical protein